VVGVVSAVAGRGRTDKGDLLVFVVVGEGSSAVGEGAVY
jgi:hypothetical protein